MSDIENKYKEVLGQVEKSEMEYRPTQQEKLKMYGLFKQISEGDISGEKPSMAKFVERAKYIAWERCKGMSKDEAMSSYVQLFDGKE